MCHLIFDSDKIQPKYLGDASKLIRDAWWLDTRMKTIYIKWIFSWNISTDHFICSLTLLIRKWKNQPFNSDLIFVFWLQTDAFIFKGKYMEGIITTGSGIRPTFIMYILLKLISKIYFSFSRTRIINLNVIFSDIF